MLGAAQRHWSITLLVVRRNPTARSGRVVWVATNFIVSLLLVHSRARAQTAGDVSTPAEGAVSTGSRLGLKLNPLGLILGRYSMDVEYLLVPHLAVNVNAHFWHFADGSSDPECDGFDCADFDAWGGELGARYYSARSSPTGFFVGPTVVADVIRYRHSDSYGDRLVQMGFDLGGQMVLGGDTGSGGLILGFGAGLTPVRLSSDFYKGDSYIGVFSVRALLQVGYAF